MALMVQLQDARQLYEGVWKAQLSLYEIRFLDARPECSGPFHVLLLTEPPTFDKEKRNLSFSLSSVRLLNAGTSDSAIFIMGTKSVVHEGTLPSEFMPHAGSGDLEFQKSLPPNLKDLGSKLIREVRIHFPGDLVFYPKSGRYVQAPDNFLTIKPQPRDRSFRITVRGGG